MGEREFVVARCTCAHMRNDPFCPRHVGPSRAIFAHTPLYAQVAWELDLNWSGSPERLFWQHKRLYEWPFFYNSLRDRVINGPMFGQPVWIGFRLIANPYALSRPHQGFVSEGFLSS